MSLPTEDPCLTGRKDSKKGKCSRSQHTRVSSLLSGRTRSIHYQGTNPSDSSISQRRDSQGAANQTPARQHCYNRIVSTLSLYPRVGRESRGEKSALCSCLFLQCYLSVTTKQPNTLRDSKSYLREIQNIF